MGFFRQTTHDTAVLMPMGKGFTSTPTGDLSSLIRTAYSALQTATTTPTSTSPLPDLKIIAITNDTISTLLSAAYLHADARTAAGIIAGTGTNAACLCPTSKLPSFKRPPSAAATGTSAVVLNTEWSINGTAAPLAPYQTTWDKLLDEKNEKPGFQPLEQMIGGRYLGELVRLIALDIFSAPSSHSPSPQQQRQLPRMLTTPYALDTKLCAQIEEAAENSDLVLSYLHECLPASAESEFKWDLAGAECFRCVCVAVSTRAAALVAAATLGLLCLNDELEDDGGDDVLVCYAGTVIEKYPRFRERCEGFVAQVVDSWRAGTRTGKKTVRFVEAKDGGILGAAVLAAMVKDGGT